MPCARTSLRRLTAVLFVCFCLCAVRGAAAEGETEPRAMLLLVPAGEDDDGYLALEQALGALVKRLGIEIRTAAVDEIPQDPRDQEDQGRRILTDDGGRAVVWIDHWRRTVILIHLDDEQRESRLERRIDCIAEHLGRCADAIASMVSSAVSSWAESPAPEAKDEPDEVEYAVDNELSPVELHKPPWTRPDPLFRIGVGGGYGGALFDGTSRGVHGFDAGLRVRIARYAQVEAIFEFWWPLKGDSSENGAWVRISRWDVAARAGAALPLDRFVLALTAGAVFDFAEVEKRSDNRGFDGSGERRKGFSAAFTVSYEPVEWLAIWVGAGIDALDSDLVYSAPDDDDVPVTLIRCDAVQGRLFGGVSFEIGFGSMGD